MLQELSHLRDTISKEAFEGTEEISAAEGHLKNLNSLYEQAKSFIAEKVGEPIAELFDSRYGIRATAKLLNAPSKDPSLPSLYAELRSVKVVVPAGMKTDFLTYGEALQTAAKTVEDLHSDVLIPFHKWVQQKLGNPSTLSSKTSTLEFPVIANYNVDALKASIDACFVEENKTQDIHVPYGQAIRRNSDWFDIAKILDTLEDKMGEKSHKAVVQKVGDLLADVDKLLYRLNDMKEGVHKASPETLKTLSEVIFTIAKDVEFYALLRHSIREYEVALNATQQKIKTTIPA